MSLFVTFEGIDRSGKTTQINILRDKLISMGIEPVMTREPGGTPASERIRDMLLSSGDIPPVTEAYLFAASRACHVRELIRPALQQGRIVLCDRFLDSSVAYQGYGRGLGEETVMRINKDAVDGLFPDITFFFDLAPEVRALRGADEDRIERSGDGFYAKVREGYLSLAERYKERIVLIDASLPVGDISYTIFERIKALL